ncbi:hypothetical protein [Psychroserpens damuponensis]|uniref:hypothetical protein n=1 Tax=Psychroserpens damuponensis TaxID=943936 RepID=UPI00058F64CD|nr:hypothetical protein [Psychroserpens damuponensis]
MKYTFLLINLLITTITSIHAQDITPTEINSTGHVLSELTADAIKNNDFESVLIFTNTIDKLKEKLKIDTTYTNYFNNIKIRNPQLNNGIVIFLNSSPQSSPGFSNRVVAHYIDLHKSGISTTDLNEYILLKKLHKGDISSQEINASQINDLKDLKAEIEAIKIEH